MYAVDLRDVFLSLMGGGDDEDLVCEVWHAYYQVEMAWCT